MAQYGIQLGTVVDVTDPLMEGRLQVMLAMAPAGWARPCRDYKSTELPPVGTKVWVLFEDGDLARPVWMGVAK